MRNKLYLLLLLFILAGLSITEYYIGIGVFFNNANYIEMVAKCLGVIGLFIAASKNFGWFSPWEKSFDKTFGLDETNKRWRYLVSFIIFVIAAIMGIYASWIDPQ